MGLLAGGLGLIVPCECGDSVAGFIDLQVDLIVRGDALAFLFEPSDALVDGISLFGEVRFLQTCADFC